MGRRKIEIQPITHERNRSVTFLKRKNGLFKKAYELGVLCSVDVAVIIFDEKPGQHEKLYEYSSTDVRDIVKRHLKFSGEKDCRGPNDFSGAAATKLDDIGEGDDDDDDIPIEEPATTASKSKSTSKASSKAKVAREPSSSSRRHSSSSRERSRDRGRHSPNPRKRSHSHVAPRDSRSRSRSPPSYHGYPGHFPSHLRGGFSGPPHDPYMSLPMSRPPVELFGTPPLDFRGGPGMSQNFNMNHLNAINALGIRDMRDIDALRMDAPRARLMYQQFMLQQQHQQQLAQRRERSGPSYHHSQQSPTDAHPHHSMHRHHSHHDVHDFQRRSMSGAEGQSNERDFGDLAVLLDSVEPRNGGRASAPAGMEWPTTGGGQGGPSSSGPAFPPELDFPAISNPDANWLDFLATSPQSGHNPTAPSGWRGGGAGSGSMPNINVGMGMRGGDAFGAGGLRNPTSNAALDRQMLVDVFTNLSGHNGEDTPTNANPGSASGDSFALPNLSSISMSSLPPSVHQGGVHDLESNPHAPGVESTNSMPLTKKRKTEVVIPESPASLDDGHSGGNDSEDEGSDYKPPGGGRVQKKPSKSKTGPDKTKDRSKEKERQDRLKTAASSSIAGSKSTKEGAKERIRRT